MNDRELVAVIEESGVVRGVTHVVDTVVGASRTSVGVQRAAALRDEWLSHPTLDRTRHTGVALIAAATVHLGLVAWHGPIAGWLWLIPSMLAIAFGSVMALAPSRGSVPERRG